jgi:small subunit ribosomal protein S9
MGGERQGVFFRHTGLLLAAMRRVASTLLRSSLPPLRRSPSALASLPPLLGKLSLSSRHCAGIASTSSESAAPPPPPPLPSEISDASRLEGSEAAEGGGEDESPPEFPLLLSHMRPPRDTSRKYIKVDEMGRAYATGRRKTSIARVWVWENTREGELPSVRVNRMSLASYFGGHWAYRHTVLAPFLVTGTSGKYSVMATCKSGGLSGQAEALRLGIATALQGLDPSLRPSLKAAGYMKRDQRKRERKKPGQAGARAKFAWVKR